MSVAIIPDFVKYQIEWLTSHKGLEFEPVIEDTIVQMLKDTGKSFIDEQPDETSRFDHIAESDPDKKIELRSAERAIEDLPSAQPETHWIPCSERLPEERGFYLTTTKDKAVYCDHWNEDNFDRTEMVIAWMPLPEAYRGGGKE